MIDTSKPLQTLLDCNIIDRDCYGSLIGSTLAKMNITTIKDLLDMRDICNYRGIGKKKAEQILELQQCVMSFIKKGVAADPIVNMNDKYTDLPIIVEKCADIPVTEIGRYIKCGDIPQSVQKVGINTLKDLWCKDFNGISLHSGFPKKKAISLQTEFRNFSQEQFDDIIFWHTQRILPSQYNSSKTLEENLQLVLDELIEYIDGCYKRESQISKLGDRKRVSHLQTILNGIYKNGKSRKDVATILKFKKNDPERVRQLLLVELLGPLFNEEMLKSDVLKCLKINKDLIKRISEFHASMIFKKYVISDACSSAFFEDVVGVDILEHTPLSYVVPSQEKICYRNVVKAFISEMGAVMEFQPIEDLVNIIDKNEIIQREIYAKKKTYDKRFIQQLLTDEDLVIKQDSGVLLRPEYIRYFGLYELGDVFQIRAIARIIVDAHSSIHWDQITAIYNERYGVKLNDNINISEAQMFGCQCVAHGYWMYNKCELLTVKRFVEQYATKDYPFTLNEVMDSLIANGYPNMLPETVKSYIAPHCAAHSTIPNYYCNRDFVDQQSNPNEWVARRKGVLNWLANNIHLFLQDKNVDKLELNVILDYLCGNTIGSPCEDCSRDELKSFCTLYFANSCDDSPFTIFNDDNGVRILSKNDKYLSTDWNIYGTKGRRSNYRNLTSKAEHIRRKLSVQPSLAELVNMIYDEYGEEILGDETYEYNSNQDRTQQVKLKIRQQLEAAINFDDSTHNLRIVRPQNRKGKENVYVALDAKRINEKQSKKYEPQNHQTVIEYKIISQATDLDWDKLAAILKTELLSCKMWMIRAGMNYELDDVVDKFINFIRTDSNKHINLLMPKNIFEFFVVSNPTDNDRYCIMCNIARYFEAFITSIYTGPLKGSYNSNTNHISGLYEKMKQWQFDDWKVLNNEFTPWYSISSDSYQYAFKTLNKVRNTDSHGEWYIDVYAKDSLSESERNIQKILKFVALYIFMFAKYTMK